MVSPSMFFTSSVLNETAQANLQAPVIPPSPPPPAHGSSIVNNIKKVPGYIANGISNGVKKAPGYATQLPQQYVQLCELIAECALRTIKSCATSSVANGLGSITGISDLHASLFDDWSNKTTKVTKRITEPTPVTTTEYEDLVNGARVSQKSVSSSFPNPPKVTILVETVPDTRRTADRLIAATGHALSGAVKVVGWVLYGYGSYNTLPEKFDIQAPLPFSNVIIINAKGVNQLVTDVALTALETISKDWRNLSKGILIESIKYTPLTVSAVGIYGMCKSWERYRASATWKDSAKWGAGFLASTAATAGAVIAQYTGYFNYK